MKSVIMIAYHFPPEGNAGVYRPLRFVRHLPSKGWKPIVITQETEAYERYDPSLLKQVPESVEIIRIRNRDPWLNLQHWRAKHVQRKLGRLPSDKVSRIDAAQNNVFRSAIRKMVRTMEAWCYHPDPEMGWIRPAVSRIVKCCAEYQPKVIWATGGPWSSFVVAQRVAELTKVPYVLDFRDAWTLVPEPFATRRPTWAVRLDRRSLDKLFKRAQAIVFRYKTEAECYWRAYPGALDATRIHIIPNGFDGAVGIFKRRTRDKCEILYSGTLAYYRYDSLIEALATLKQIDCGSAAQLAVTFVGEQSGDLLFQASKRGLTDMITALGPVSHSEITKLQRDADALLMLEREPTMKGYELLAGAKLFEYLKFARPIIGVLPDGEAKKVLQAVGVPTIADPNSVEDIIRVFRLLHRAWLEGKMANLVPNSDACAAFSAESQTLALTHALEGREPVDRFVPGLIEIPPSLRDDIENGNWIDSRTRVPSPA